MNNKLRQVTDSIHGTIYLSGLESEFISTPFFYRLHDIYQSSTVYMTFPSNRTKRYEHSLGTMEIASDMLFSAMSNASTKTQDAIYSQLDLFWREKVYQQVLNYNNESSPRYITSVANEIDELFGENKQQDLGEEIKVTFSRGVMKDSALDQYQFYRISIEQDECHGSVKEFFSYRCLLQAVRLVALFHDVGHPPFSHVVEEAMKELYDSIKNESGKTDSIEREKVRKDFEQVLALYAENTKSKAYKCNMMCTKSSLIDAPIHERIGLAFLQCAIDDVIPERIKSICNNSSLSDSEKRVMVLYTITVSEMVMSILTEADSFFKSIHRLVDGPVDADRLDYIVRDSINSGVDWGTIPYKRLIRSCKFFCMDEVHFGKNEYKDTKDLFAVAFPKKNSDAITDLLVTRYKIFARINFHHRCVKTGAALKACVRGLSEDYLKNTKHISEEISSLWSCLLTAKAGKNSRRIIQWNDSWLISVLHKALVFLSIESKEKEKNERLFEDLEEILLNKKKYYSLIKRGDDQKELVLKVLEEVMTDSVLEELIQKEKSKFEEKNVPLDTVMEEKGFIGAKIDSLFGDKDNAYDSLQRLELYKRLKKTGDLSLLNILLPLYDKSMKDVLEETLIKMQDDRKIRGKQIFENGGREKIGVPSHDTPLDNIFLYSDEECVIYNEQGLLQQLNAIQSCVSSYNIYYIPPNDADPEKVGIEIIEAAKESLSKQYENRFNEMFSKR